MKRNRPQIRSYLEENHFNIHEKDSIYLMETERVRIKKEIKKLEIDLQKEQIKKREREQKKDRLKNIEISFKKNGIAHLLQLNSQYLILKEEVKLPELTANENLNSSLIELKKNLVQIENKLDKWKVKKNGGRKLVVRQGYSNRKQSGKFERKDIDLGSKRIHKSEGLIQNIPNEYLNHLNLSNDDIKGGDLKAKGNGKKSKSQQLRSLSANKPDKSKFGLPRPVFQKPYKSLSSVNVTFEIEWENVFFLDSKIVLKHQGNWFEKHIPNSKKYLNAIKPYYRFHNVPKLKVTVINSIVNIENEEVLFYHIDFLAITAASIENQYPTKLELKYWEKYTKNFYKTKLSFLFHTYTLEKLCEYCDPSLPIIPVGEVIISGNGTKRIDSSFLFPIKAMKGYFVVWESTENAKASYVFSIDDYTNSGLQKLYNYIAGETQNKRIELINSKLIQSKLGMKMRIFHTDLNEWVKAIQKLIVSG